MSDGTLMPNGYRWLLDKGLAGTEPFTSLEPWYLLKEGGDAFIVNEVWPNGPSARRLRAFARRQDCDDIACFVIGEGPNPPIVVIEGWTSEITGYELGQSYDSFWEWMKSIIDDIASCAEQTY